MPVDLAPPPSRRPLRAAARVGWAVACALFVSAALVGCGESSARVADERGAAGAGPASATPRGASENASASATAQAPLVSFLGDSITAGLHLPAEEAFPALLAERLAAAGRPVRIVNAGLSGDTTAGGLRRLAWQLRQEPDVLVVELGGNDALRGQDLASVEQNLLAIVRGGKASGALVLLLGMKIPPNYGLDYARGFEQIYERVAEQEDVPLIPFFMEGVALRPGMMLSDGLHPSAAGHRVLADTVQPELIALLDQLDEGRD